MAGIYIHIPFCKKACHYCNFHFSTQLRSLPDMVRAIGREAVLRKDYLQERVDSVYFGGGTPSLLAEKDLQELMGLLHQHFSISPFAEITLEANPDDVHNQQLASWKQAGINRLSMGIQSFFEEDLRWMNRAHTATEALEGIKRAQEAGFANITIDLIYGTPGLSDDRWQQNLQTATDLHVPHLSCYALTVEPKTALEKKISKGEQTDVDPSQQAVHFHMLMNHMAQQGYEHYEISNFAKPGFRAQHNSSYWQGVPYLGLGPSAHSFNGKSRQWNIANNALYLTSLRKDEIPAEMETLTTIQQLNEYIMTSLRTLEGCSLQRIKAQWGQAVAKDIWIDAQVYVKDGLMTDRAETLVLTPQGRFLADGIAADLFRDEKNQ